MSTTHLGHETDAGPDGLIEPWGQEAFDLTGAAESGLPEVLQGQGVQTPLVATPAEISPTATETVVDPAVVPDTPPTEEPQPQSSRSSRRKLGLIVGSIAAGGALVGGILVGGITHLLSNDDERIPSNNEPVASAPATPRPEESTQPYNSRALIGNKNDMSIAEAQRIAGFYSSAIPSDAVVRALAQCSPSEIKSIRTDIDDYDPNNNSQIGVILKQYGLNTDEVPMNMNSHIGNANDFTWGDVTDLTIRFSHDVSPDNVRKALISASQEDINTLRSILENREDPQQAAIVMKKYGITMDDWIPDQSATFGDTPTP
jgi:hypothetical protein